MKNMRKEDFKHIAYCSLFVAVAGMAFWLIGCYDSALFIAISWLGLLSLYHVVMWSFLSEKEQAMQQLWIINENLQKTIDQEKSSKTFMANYIDELEKLIVDDKDKKKVRRKDKKRSKRKKKRARM